MKPKRENPLRNCASSPVGLWQKCAPLLLELRPAALTQARFPDLLKQLSEAVIGRARLPIQLDVTGDYEMPPEVKVAFYRIAQESLNNIVKYARATQVEIKLSQECCNVHLEIKDNGSRV